MSASSKCICPRSAAATFKERFKSTSAKDETTGGHALTHEHDISTTREILWWLSKGYGFGSVTNGLFLLLIIVRAPGSKWSHLVYLELFEDQRIGVYVLISPRNMAI